MVAGRSYMRALERAEAHREALREACLTALAEGVPVDEVMRLASVDHAFISASLRAH